MRPSFPCHLSNITRINDGRKIDCAQFKAGCFNRATAGEAMRRLVPVLFFERAEEYAKSIKPIIDFDA